MCGQGGKQMTLSCIFGSQDQMPLIKILMEKGKLDSEQHSVKDQLHALHVTK